MVVGGDSDGDGSTGPSSGGGKQEVKLPWKVLILIYGVLFSDSIAGTIITPFVPGALT